MPLSRRQFLATTAALIASGCNSPVIDATVQVANYLVRGVPSVPVTREKINRIPYAAMRAKIGNGPRSLLILGRYDGPDLYWIAADRSLLATRGGRLVKTAGLSVNLKNTRFVDPDPVANNLHQVGGAVEALRIIDIDEGNHFSIPVHTSLKRIGSERIEILELYFDTVVFRERNVAELLDWEFENYFWADQKSGFIWKSTQHIVKAFPPVEMEILRPAA